MTRAQEGAIIFQMSYLICEKHNRNQKVASKLANNAYICMNRYCPQSFKVFCSSCKNEHRDHSIKVLTIEDISFLVDRLLKAPFREVGRVVGQSLDIMKKLKLIKEFRKKIDILEKEVQKESLRLIEQTEILIEEYSKCKENVGQLAEMFARIEEADVYRQFLGNSQELLANLDYNFKKDKFQFGSTVIKEKEDRRRKSVEQSKRKIQEVRDYSMKIIEVILHNDDSEEQQEDIFYQKKHYEVLKEELSIDKNEKELDDEIFDLKNSNTSMVRSRIKRDAANVSVQTEEDMVSQEESDERMRAKIVEINQMHTKQENDYKLKLGVVTKQKENLNREMAKLKQRHEQKKRQLREIQLKMRDNRTNRTRKQQARQQIMGKIIEYSQSKMTNSEERND